MANRALAEARRRHESADSEAGVSTGAGISGVIMTAPPDTVAALIEGDATVVVVMVLTCCGEVEEL